MAYSIASTEEEWEYVLDLRGDEAHLHAWKKGHHITSKKIVRAGAVPDRLHIAISMWGNLLNVVDAVFGLEPPPRLLTQLSSLTSKFEPD